jgi:hypothetical protein
LKLSLKIQQPAQTAAKTGADLLWKGTTSGFLAGIALRIIIIGPGEGPRLPENRHFFPEE